MSRRDIQGQHRSTEYCGGMWWDESLHSAIARRSDNLVAHPCSEGLTGNMIAPMAVETCGPEGRFRLAPLRCGHPVSAYFECALSVV